MPNVNIDILKLENWLYNDTVYSKEELKKAVKSLIIEYKRLKNEKKGS